MSQPTTDGTDPAADVTDPAGDGADPAADATGLSPLRSYVGSDGPVSVGALLGAVALVPTAAVLVVRLLRNTPVGLPAVVRGAAPAVATLAAVAPALAALALAVATPRRAERVALASVGVFALLGAVDAAAWLPAAAAILVGTAVTLAVELGSRADGRTGAEGSQRAALAPVARPGAAAALGVLALAVSLATSAGIGTTTLGPAGAALAFATLAALPLVRGVDGTLALGLWAVATFAVVVAAASAPFVAGAVVLVAFGAGTVPLALLALGIGGAVATAVADARRRAVGPAVGAALLLFAGVPDALPRAVAFALGLVVLVREWGASDPLGDGGDGTESADRGRSATAGGGADA